MNPEPAKRRRGSVAATSRLFAALCAVVLAVVFVPAAGAIDDPTIGPPREDPLPVQINITAITPTMSTPSEDPVAVVSITAEVTNKGEQTIDDMWARLQRDNRVSDRAALNALDSDQPTYSGDQGSDVDLDFVLEPGESGIITITATVAELGIEVDGTYPIMLNLNGDIGGEPQRVGQATIYLPHATPTGKLQTSWVWPLIDRPRQSAIPDVFIDDGLAAAITEDGRLDVLLRAAEQYGAAANLTLFVDPALIDDLSAMSDGYSVREPGGQLVEGVGEQEAVEFLERLVALAAQVAVATTGYADPDVVPLVRGGLAELVSQARDYGTKIVEDALQIETISEIDWPVNGAITTDAIAAENAAGVSHFLLSGAAFGEAEFLSSPDEITESALTSLDGQSEAIVVDPALSRIISEGGAYAAGTVAATQRLRTELFTILAEDTASTRNVMLVPPRQWAPTYEYASALLEATTTATWLSPVGIAEVLTTDPVDRGELIYPQQTAAQELPADSIAMLPPTISAIDQLRSAFLESEADEILAAPRASLFRAASVAHRGSSSSVAATVEDITASLEAIRGGLYIVPPSDGTYTLSSDEAPLVFTVQNTLDVTVRYRLTLDATRSSGLTTSDGPILEIGPNQRATVQLDTTVQRSGSFSIVAQVLTPDGQQLGDDVRIKVNSSAYGTVALAVTGAAFLLLLLLIGRRAIKRHRFRVEQRSQALEQERPAHVTLDEQTIDSSWLEDGDEPTDSAPPHSRGER